MFKIFVMSGIYFGVKSEKGIQFTIFPNARPVFIIEKSKNGLFLKMA